MDLEIRPIADTDEDWSRFWPVVEAAFGETLVDGEADEWRGNFEFDRSLAAFDGERIVGTGGAYSLELTLPGLTTVPVGGLTAIGVLPTYRRRGILRATIERHLQDVEARGEPLSVLNASESAIYGRFGYGAATWSSDLEIDTRFADFGEPPETPGRVRMVDAGEGEKLLPEFYERARRAQPGELTRGPAVWASYFRDPQWYRHGASQHYDVIYEDADGRVDGWVSYRVEAHWEGGLPSNAIRVRELYGLTPAARAALWRFCLDLDLAGAVKMINRPLDEPLGWLLADPRRLRVTSRHDDLWVRLLDLPVALAARRYAIEGGLVLQVADRLRPANDGRFALDAGTDGASCQPTRDEPDLVLGVDALGAAYLGGVRFTTLAAAGRVTERTPGTLERADLLFSSNPLPWSTTSF
jgi:predicted acetyltransferase